MECNYKDKVSVQEPAEGLSSERCRHVGITSRELLLHHEVLEVCADEFAADLTTGARLLEAFALCPTCRQLHNLDAQNQHNPCKLKARRSRETFL
jgi:hypothetical protein